MPLPAKLFVVAGPRAQAAYAALFGSSAHPLSLSRGDTFEALLKATGIVLAVFATLALARRRAMLLMLAAAAAGAAFVSAGAGLLFESSDGSKIYGARDLAKGAEERYWRSAVIDEGLSTGVGRIESAAAPGAQAFVRRTVNVGDIFGPFANSNGFGGYMAVVLPMLLALLLAFLQTRRGGWAEEGGFSGTPEGNFTLLTFFALAAGTASVVYSRSLGGLGGLITGFAAVGALTAVSRRATRGVIVTAAVVLAAGVAAAAVFHDRAGALAINKLAERAAVWKVAARVAADYPVLGTGLGTYGAVAPHFEDTEFKFLHAHNDYLELLAEAGVLLLAAAAALAVWQSARLARGAFLEDVPYCSAIATGAFGSMAAAAFHCAFDFPLHVPATALTLAVFVSMGAVAATGYPADIETAGFREYRIFRGRGKAAAVLVAGLIAITAGGLAAAATARAGVLSAEARTTLASLDRAVPAQEPAELAAVSEGLSRAIRLAPLDGEIRYQAARLDVFSANYRKDQAETLRARAKRRLADATRLSPASSWYALAAVDGVATDARIAREWPAQCFAFYRRLAETSFEEGRDYAGFAQMRKALALAAGDPARADADVNAAVAGLVARFGAYDRVSSAAPDTFAGHLLFAQSLLAAGEREGASAEYALAARCGVHPDKDSGLSERAATDLAEALTRAGRPDEAADFYTRILARKPRWQYARLSYARFLIRQGRRDDAAAEVDKVLASPTAQWLADEARTLKDSISGI